MKELQILRELLNDQPLVKWLGIELLDAGSGWVKERLPFRPEFLQPGVIHGGIIYALADTVAAHALLTRVYPDQWCATVEQKINFLRPVAEGAIVGHGRVVHLGNRIVYAEAEVFDASDQLVAKSTATLMRLANPSRLQ